MSADNAIGCVPSSRCNGVAVGQITKSQKDTGENHAISALKFEIIKEFLVLGWNVLLSDIDIVVVQVRASLFALCAVATPVRCRGSAASIR